MQTQPVCFDRGAVLRFGEWLSHRLEERGWSVRDLAKKSGVSKNSIYGYLCDGHDPALMNALAIYNALGYIAGVIKNDN